MLEQEAQTVNLVRHGPKPGLKKPQVRKLPRQIPTRSLGDFPHLNGRRPILTIVKVHHPNKGYKLVWQFIGQFVWCQENQIVYGSRGKATENGGVLAQLLGVVFKP